MGKIVVSNFKEKFTSLVNGNTCPNSEYFKHILSIEGDCRHFSAFYTISYAKVRDEDENNMYIIGKVVKIGVKLLTGALFLEPTVEATVDTYCHLIVDIVSAHGDVIKMKYDVSVSNGSVIHKKIVRERELLNWEGRMESIKGLTVNNQNITLSLKQFLNLRNRTINVTEISLKDNRFELTYC